MREHNLSVAAVGPRTLIVKLRSALDRLDGRLVDAALTSSILEGSTTAGAAGEVIDVFVIQASSRAPSRAAAMVRAALEGGASSVLAVVPVTQGTNRMEMLEAGAIDVVAPSVPAKELAHRIRQVMETSELRVCSQQQERELELITSLARELVRSPENTTLYRDALSGLGRSIGLASVEIRVLSSPWRVDAEASAVVGWSRDGGLTRSSQVALDPLDIEALRSRTPVPSRPQTGQEMALPLLVKGQTLAVLRATPMAHSRVGESSKRALQVIGSLLAGAMEYAEQVASLQGHSKNLEAQVAERSREAQAHQLLFQAVVDALPVSLHAIDRAFRVVVWNLGREAGPFGRPRGEVLGQNLFGVIGDDEGLKKEFEEVFETGETRVTEVQGRAQTPPRLFRVEKIPMRLGLGDEVTHVITVSRDVTEQRALERTMARTEKMAAVGRLAAGIAHEINNPLATIAGTAEAMQRQLNDILDDEGRRELGQDASVIEEEAYRCKDILGSLLDFSRTAPQQRGPCQMGEIAQRALRLLRHNPRIEALSIELEIEPDLPSTMASGDQLVQVLLALLLNAADASPEGSVLIRARKGGRSEVLLSVQDDGPGIPSEIHDRIFEPFYTTKPVGQGTGLGLAVAYGLVEAHGGRLEMSSVPGRGARFDIIMPACSREPAEVGHE